MQYREKSEQNYKVRMHASIRNGKIEVFGLSTIQIWQYSKELWRKLSTEGRLLERVMKRIYVTVNERRRHNNKIVVLPHLL